MTVARLAEVLQGLQFNQRYHNAKVLIDPGVRDYLVRASRAAAVDPSVKVRHAWRGIGIKPRGSP